MSKSIYTHDEAAQIVELFEGILDKYDIAVPSPEDHERNADNCARLYGSTYSDLLDQVENKLIDILSRKKHETSVVPYFFSSGQEDT